MATIHAGIIQVTILFVLSMIIVPCIAVEPAWTFTDGERELNGVAVAPDGSSVVVGTGKVVLLAKNGTLLANEPFGEIIAQSGDGSTIVSAYSSSVASTVYLFKKNKDASGHLFLQKIWENTLPDLISSIAISDKGDYIALSAVNKGITVYNGKTGKRLGYSDKYASRIAISARGLTIAGISPSQGLRVYNPQGMSTKKYDITLAGQPNNLLMDASGDKVVFNSGPQIIAFNLSDGSEYWKTRSSGDINKLAMTPTGSNIVAGIENGAIEFYDAEGNLKWTYSNTGTGTRKAIRSVALTRDGSKIIAGSVDGKVILLDSDGNLTWMYDTAKDPVRLVAIAADGSLAVASTENTLYAFSTESRGTQPNRKTTSTKIPTVTSEDSSVTSPEIRSTPGVSISTQQKNIMETPTVTITEYSVIRKATQSPLGEMGCITALIILVFHIAGNNRR